MDHMSGMSDHATTHNMMVVGQQTVFLSHLPMFNGADGPGTITPHRFQVLLEATFSKAGGDPQKLYADDRKNHPETRMYTLHPERFVLSDLNPKSTDKPMTSFKADLFRGHFERDPHELLVSGVQVNVTNVIHFREFDPEAAKLAHLEYLLFGKGNELFLAHFITRPPDFDQIIRVSIPDHPFSDAQLQQGVHVVCRSRANSLEQRIGSKPNEEVEVVVPKGLLPGTRGERDLPVKVKAGTEFYFEEGELRVPATFEPTDAEQAAGFG
jgi:hypothetical protein